MKQSLLWTFGVIALAMVAFGTRPADAQPTSAGPYYATPSWDQTLPSATRFIILSNFGGAAVLDRNTGLVWEKSPDTATSVNWSFARFNCADRIVGGQKAFRLPSIAELSSLVDPSAASSGLALPPGHPFQVIPAPFYWSATTNAESPTNALVVAFDSGNVASIFNKTASAVAWCVRGGMNADQY